MKKNICHNRIMTKMESNRGASILVALLVFLVCAMVGSVILTAASVASGRVASLKDYTQQQTEVDSAAQMLSKLLDGYKFSIDELPFNVTTVSGKKRVDNSVFDDVGTSAKYTLPNAFLNLINYTLFNNIIKYQWTALADENIRGGFTDLSGYIDLSTIGQYIDTAGEAQEILDVDLPLVINGITELKMNDVKVRIRITPEYKLIIELEGTSDNGKLQSQPIVYTIEAHIAAFCVVPDAEISHEASINLECDRPSVFLGYVNS